MAALRTLWAAVISLYDETLVLVGGNLLWVVLNVPFVIVLVALGVLLPGVSEAGGAQTLLIAIAWLLLLLPTPASVALGGLARVAAGPEAPRVGAFWAALKAYSRLSAIAFVISFVVAAALLWNVAFYASLDSILRFVFILWLYGLLFWLCMHLYLVPLLLHVSEPRLPDLYRRAALIVLGHPIYTLVLLIGVVSVGILSIVFLPAYVLVGGSYVALIRAHAFREIRRRHGELPLEPDAQDEVAAL
ncbi:MAG: hypothetical protein JOY61_08255 [Chloroflexi bacterium]|nr:hypothetical protein [Chloroflexota bacterium]